MSKKKKTLDELLEEVLVSEDEQPFEIPESWVWVELNTVAESIQYGYTESASFEEIGPKFLRITDIQDNRVDWESVPYCVIKENEFKKYKLEKNDILVARTGATTGKSYKIEEVGKAVFASYLIRIRLNKLANASFIDNYMKSPAYWNQIMLSKKGIAQPGANSKILGALKIPLPSIKEQKRIVDKIEILFAKIDEAKKLIKEAEESFEVRKQTILRDAFQGKFTETQREEKELIKFESKDKFLNDENPNFEIPEEWQWVRLGELIDSISDYHANGSYKVLKEHVELLDTPDYALMIRATNFEKNNFESLNKYITKSAYEFLSKSKLFGGEILMSKIGNTGSVYLMPNLNKPCSLAMNLFSMKVNEDFNNEYIYFYLNSPMGKVNIEKYIKGVTTTSIDKISVKSIYIPLPSRREQDLIVKKIKALLDLEEHINKNIISELEGKLEFIKQSILSKAFKGELVTNDLTDEPAVELLKSILQEKL